MSYARRESVGVWPHERLISMGRTASSLPEVKNLLSLGLLLNFDVIYNTMLGVSKKKTIQYNVLLSNTYKINTSVNTLFILVCVKRLLVPT